MFEIDDRARRASVLGNLGGVEKTVFIAFDGTKSIFATTENDVDRTNEAGKASSVQFLHFQFTDEGIRKFKNNDINVSIGINHKNYGHTVAIPQNVRQSLYLDFAG